MVCGEPYNIFRERGRKLKIYEDFLVLLIEDARRNLNDSAKYRSLTDPSILELSQRLDNLLNVYHSITQSMRIAS